MRPRDTFVDIQQLDEDYNDLPVQMVSIEEALRRWDTYNNAETLSNVLPPINMLNISDPTHGHWPAGLSKYFQLLFDACGFSDDTVLSRLRSKSIAPRPDIGKQAGQVFCATDIRNCIQFRILAQRGAASSWHMDNAGVWTFVTLEGNKGEGEEEDEDVVKYWPIFPMDQLGLDERARALADFAKHGTNWRPKPECKIPVISLIRGDTLIMPPGTIHAPISLTDCFCLGGMCMNKKFIQRTLEVWLYLCRKENCTNEAQPKQARAIIDYIQNLVHADPVNHGYRLDDLKEFDNICDEISGRCLKCSCSTGCKAASCTCLKFGQRCGPHCHLATVCQNPHGHPKSKIFGD
jgi:hypothetical protein